MAKTDLAQDTAAPPAPPANPEPTAAEDRERVAAEDRVRVAAEDRVRVAAEDRERVAVEPVLSLEDYLSDTRQGAALRGLLRVEHGHEKRTATAWAALTANVLSRPTTGGVR